MVDGYRAHERARTHVQNWLKASEEHWEPRQGAVVEHVSAAVKTRNVPANARLT